LSLTSGEIGFSLDVSFLELSSDVNRGAHSSTVLVHNLLDNG
jgi:hypothetical protein